MATPSSSLQTHPSDRVELVAVYLLGLHTQQASFETSLVSTLASIPFRAVIGTASLPGWKRRTNKLYGARVAA